MADKKKEEKKEKETEKEKPKSEGCIKILENKPSRGAKTSEGCV